MQLRKTAVVLCLLVTPVPAPAQQQAVSPHADSARRQIAALSEEDLVQLRSGQGWGLALPAELNGVPGPTHLLELAAEIRLSAEQIAELTRIRDGMRKDAVEAGDRFIASERALNDAFVGGVPDPATLAELVGAAADARAALRLTHLSAHLQTLPLLTPHQVASYARLRGYERADPCSAVPEGHDATMWRAHNGCDP